MVEFRTFLLQTWMKMRLRFHFTWLMKMVSFYLATKSFIHQSRVVRRVFLSSLWVFWTFLRMKMFYWSTQSQCFSLWPTQEGPICWSFPQIFRLSLHFLSIYRSLFSWKCGNKLANRIRMSIGKIAKRFAIKPHGYTHLPTGDLAEICKRPSILTSVLNQALKSASERLKTCKKTGHPQRMRKVSLYRVLEQFNEHARL